MNKENADKIDKADIAISTLTAAEKKEAPVIDAN